MADELAMAKLVPVQRGKTLGEYVYGQLKGALMSGTFQPGQKLSARSVADAVGVSFTPAREALSRL
ncbi:MAG: GntR family transcriptional regulator, partial [Gammaproteobacteria bacterium]|nr:GntR family transcriptional regulator [Gammaproteobacteria bacterium]